MNELIHKLKEYSDYTVVCVDDEESILMIQAEMVRSLGLHVFSAPDAQTALDYIKDNQHKIALILSDIKMPGIDGFEFRKRMLEFTNAIPFMIISGHVDRDMALQGIDLKISGFLDKPFHLKSLSDLIQKEVIPRINNLKEEEELLGGFVSESADLLESSEQSLLELERNPGAIESLNSLFGCIHTLKGASSFFHPKTLHQFAHRYEDYLKQIQKGELSITPDLISAFLAGLDVIRDLMRDLKNHISRDLQIEDEINRIFGRATAKNTGAEPAPTHATADKAEPAKEKTTEIKIPLTTLDEFMQLSGEMTVIRNMINKCVRTIEKRYAGDKEVNNLGELLQELHKINAGIQDKMSDLRKVSIRHTLKPLSRGSRDVAKALKKEIQLEFSGEDLTVDTSISDVLSKTLFHLLKNSIDHGIEMPDDRVQKGKAAVGQISLHASIQNEQVIIEIKDDGRGINDEALKKKALQNNLFSAEEIAQMSKEEAHNLIFASGLSTAAQVTDVSGRGVGMSMVKSTIEDANGRIEIQSQINEGTTFKIVLPVPQSVLITDCLFVRCSNQIFGLQQKEIFRVLKRESTQGDQIKKLQGTELFELDGELLPLVSLASLIGIPETEKNPASEALNLVIIQSSQHAKKVALWVNEISDIEDTVIKPILPNLNQHQIYLGATFLDDGTVGLILDAAGLLTKAKVEVGKKLGLAHASKKLDGAHTENHDCEYLLFDLPLTSSYAIPQEKVFRIEKRSSHLIRKFGQQSVIPYRGSALPIIDLSQTFFEEPLPENDILTLIIVNSNRGLVGLQVSAVRDFIKASAWSAENNFHLLTLGTVLVKDQIVTVISTENLIEEQFTAHKKQAA